MQPLMTRYTPVPMQQVKIDSAFWTPRQDLVRQVTLPHIYRQLQAKGYLDAFEWSVGQPNPPHIFWDSDLGKWLEAVGYVLARQPAPQLEAWADDLIDRLCAAQQVDGYLNLHFTRVEPTKRWSNLRDWHELYCAGHLIEAAVAYYEATGKRRLLDVMCRYADYIASVFGTAPGQRRGYCGHPEIELALVRLYRATGERRFLDLSRYFVDERGQRPHCYDLEAEARGEQPSGYWARTYEYCQAHVPLREQTEAVGHSVRAMYIYCAMTDLALETGDPALLSATRQLFASVCERQMYITGGIGPAARNEGFTRDFDLPNETAYAETCAAIGLFLWMHRMGQTELRGAYADVMERVLYNGILSGVALTGDRFFYSNPLAVHRHLEDRLRPPLHRPSWYDCACCPPNLARVISALGGYIYGQTPDALVVHHYVQGTAQVVVSGQPFTVQQKTSYPWDGQVDLVVTPETPVTSAICLRIPGWCRAYRLAVNGEIQTARVDDGYVRLYRLWHRGDCISLELDMPAIRVYGHLNVTADHGRVAIQRGPLVYCLEGADNGDHLDLVRLPTSASLSFEPSDMLGGLVRIRATGARDVTHSGDLYRTDAPEQAICNLVAVPYFAWDNRASGDLIVWIREVSA